jgi:hypothetical protein
MHRITLLVGLCTTFLLMTAACEGRGPAQQAGGDDQVVEEIGGVIANLDEAEPLEQVDQAMDEAGPTDLKASAEGEASADAADEEIGG